MFMKLSTISLTVGSCILLAAGLTGCSAVTSAGIPPAKPATATLGAQADTSGPGTVTFGGSSIDLNQNAGVANFAVDRTGGSTGAVTVHYATANGTALAGTDYQTKSGTLSWADGETGYKTITLNDLETAKFTGSRDFTITLSAPTGGATLGTYPVRDVVMTDTFTAPSTLFDFTPYKLTLPIDQYRGSGGTGGIQFEAWTVPASQLNAGFADSDFYVSGSSVIFRDPSNGAVTSPGGGSDHTRSELRELYTGTGHDANSDWNSSIGGTLTAQCTVQANSADSDETTIGQIHGQNNAFMLLIYRPSPYNDIQVVAYTYNNGSSTHTRSTVVSGISLNQTINYSINYSGTTVTTVVNGVTKVLSGVDSSWTNTGVYFKLGAYASAPNTGNPSGDKTQVAFQAFNITH